LSKWRKGPPERRGYIYVACCFRKQWQVHAAWWSGPDGYVTWCGDEGPVEWQPDWLWQPLTLPEPPREGKE
jgi:hypothetical protein